MGTTEEWKDIKGYEGLYQVSNIGRVRSLTYRRCVNGIKTISQASIILKSFDNGKGYKVVTLKKEKKKNHYVHRLVADAFIPNPDALSEVNHRDFDRGNNNALNLEWCTRKQNIDYSIENRAMQHNTVGRSGIRYISIDSKGRYRVCIKRAETDKRFKTLDDAITYRNEVLNEINYTI